MHKHFKIHFTKKYTNPHIDVELVNTNVALGSYILLRRDIEWPKIMRRPTKQGIKIK